MEMDRKDYYQILKVKPGARPEEISARYIQFSSLYEHLVTNYPLVPEYFQRMSTLDEAYEILSDPSSRESYDRTFQVKLSDEITGIESEFRDAIAQVSEEMGKIKKIGSRLLWTKIPTRGLRMATISLVSLLLIGIVGTTLALAFPRQVMAAPFRTTAIAMAETSTGAISLIEDARKVTASFERDIVSTAFQSMRIDQSLSKLEPAITPTNDMAVFPSVEHPLYPLYVDKQFSAFRYTVDTHGNVQVDGSTAITDAFLDRIETQIAALEGTN